MKNCRRVITIKVFVNRENSGWIFDHIHSDYVNHTRHEIVGLKDNPDVCWFLNPWGFVKVDCPSFVHIHHIDDTKIKQWDFDKINKFAKGCIVPNKHTEEVLKKYINVPIYRFPYWVLTKMTAPECVPDAQIDKDYIFIGSFQKDSEGRTNKPKLSKGPDIFLDILAELKNKEHIFKVILTGYNRGYIIEGLERMGIPFEYHEKTSYLTPLYDKLDWYFVTSRTEGGPQAVLEASYRKVKILSTDVGIASEVLHSDCICKSVDDFVSKFRSGVDKTEYNQQNVLDNYMCEDVVKRFDDFFEEQLCADS